MFQTATEIPADVIRRIFLLLTLSDLKRARLVCSSWNLFIYQQIWCSKDGKQRLKRKLNANWEEKNPSDIVNKVMKRLNIRQPYVLHATKEFLILIEYPVINERKQYLWIYNIEQRNYWKTSDFGPVKKIKVLQQTNSIPVKTFINKNVFCLLFQNCQVDSNQCRTTLKVWSTKSKKAIFQQSIVGYPQCSFLSSQSTLVFIKSAEIAFLQFNKRKLKQIHRNDHHLKILEENIEGHKICNKFIILWLKSSKFKKEIEMVVWENIEFKTEIAFQFDRFRNFTRLIDDKYNQEQQFIETEMIRDVVYVDSKFILLIQVKIIDDMMLETYEYENDFQDTFVKIVNKEGIPIQKIMLTDTIKTQEKFTNTSFLFNENRLLVKSLTSSFHENLYLFKLNAVLDSVSSPPVKIIQVLVETSESYKLDNHYPTIYSKAHGYFLTTNILGVNQILTNFEILWN